MLEGITVLNQFDTSIFNGTAFFICFMITIFIGAIAFITISIVTMEDAWFLGILGSILLGVMLGAAAGDIWFDTMETRYQVTISEEVSMTEFYERYEIIEQNGEIFTITERIDKDAE